MDGKDKWTAQMIEDGAKRIDWAWRVCLAGTNTLR